MRSLTKVSVRMTLENLGDDANGQRIPDRPVIETLNTGAYVAQDQADTLTSID